MVNLLQFDRAGLGDFCEQLGEKRFRATQLFRWIHQRGERDPAAMTDLAKSLRDKLAGSAVVEALPVASEQVAADGTIKWLFDVGAGDAIETVFIPEADRGTLCISSQAGCAVELPVLLHRPPGLQPQPQHRRDRRPALACRVRAAPPPRARRRRARHHQRGDDGHGRAAAELRRAAAGARIMLDDHGYGLSRRRVTVSTSGVVPMIDRLRDDCPVALAVSLHAPDDALRDELVPLNRKYPIAELLAACRSYLARAPRDFITLEYCMLDGVNDSPEQARALLALVRGDGSAASGLACKINLIPFNPFPASGLHRSPPERVAAFAAVLQQGGIVTTVRKTRGDDIAAACGQLAGEVQDRTRVAERSVRAVPVRVERGVAGPVSRRAGVAAAAPVRSAS